jgi:putative oxidoreductase
MAFTYLKRDPDRGTVAWSFLLIRLVIGVILMAHGALKLGLFGGESLAAWIQRSELGMMGYLVIGGEILGGLCILLGFLVRFFALTNIIFMVGAIVRVSGRNGFFLGNGLLPDGQPVPDGFEFNLALITLLLPLMLAGPGPYTLLRLFVKHPPAPLE